MSQSEGQITLKESDREIKTFQPFLDLSCCICRREILGNELVTQCPNCLTFFHSNHLDIWVNGELPPAKLPVQFAIASFLGLIEIQNGKHDCLL